MKTLVLTITLLAGALAMAIAQGKKSVVIGTMIDRPNAVLVINPPNKDQGFLLPQLTTTERLGIAPSSPQDDGLVVYDITDESFYYWNNGIWIKGLGDNTVRSLTYDAATQALSLSGGGGTISLSTLKEVPATSGQAGKYLTTDGTTLSWVSLGTLGDITSLIAGQGLTGGATSGDINLSVNTDGTTISVNGSNQLQLSNGAVTNSKLAANAVNSSNISDGTITGTDILDNTISTNDLINASVTGPKIASGAVGTTQINSGGNNKVLSTDGTGAVTWVDRSTFNDDNQNLTLAGNTLNIDNGTAANLNNLTAAGDVAGSLSALAIQPGSVNSAKIQDGSVTTTDLTTGGNNKVLTTDGTGLVNWADRSTFVDDNQNLTLAGNTLNIDNGTAANLNNITAAGDVAGSLSALTIQPGAVNATTDIITGGNDKVLTTNGTGVVAWADRSTFVDDNQNLGFSGNTLTIDNGTPVNLSANGQVTGLLDNLVIQPGTSNQVMVTNPAGTASTWTTPGGDITGPLNTTTVGRIQGRDVANTAPNNGDALIWNGTAWAPAVVSVAPVTDYYAIDPSAFQGLEPSGGADGTITGLYQADNTFISSNQAGREIMAPVNLPHNAVIQRITVYYLNEDLLLLGNIVVRFYRKTFTGTTNQTLTNTTIPYNLLAPGNQNTDLPNIPVANRVIDNSTYTYRIHVIFDDAADGPGDATQRIYGVKIEYTK